MKVVKVWVEVEVEVDKEEEKKMEVEVDVEVEVEIGVEVQVDEEEEKEKKRKREKDIKSQNKPSVPKPVIPEKKDGVLKPGNSADLKFNNLEILVQIPEG